MCGIAGIVKLDPRERVEPERLVAMRDALRHRGPDDAGQWIEGPVGLASRRLAIVDVAGGHQPMASEDKSAWIAYNGEVYNHSALRRELESRGHRYRTRSDTETVLHAYEELGERCVDRLQGMFAFALWDRSRRQLLLARDRLGIKPLYYAVADGEILFGSEIKAILAAGSIRPELNEAILPEFLATRFVSGDETFFQGIRKLLPGRILTWSIPDGVRVRRTWRLAVHPNGRPQNLKSESEELRERLGETCRTHLMSDVPLGVFLSGGLDSSALAALMARAVKEPIHTFSVGFDDPGSNELAYARIAARAVGAEHREVVVSPEEFFGALPRLVWHEDEPIAFPASVPLYFVSRLAREHVKVVLTGEGADELFLGYNRYRVTAWNERLGRAYHTLAPRPLRGAVSGLVGELPRALRRYGERTFLNLEPGPRQLFFENFAVFSEPLQRRLLSDGRLLAARDPYGGVMRSYQEATGDVLDRMSQADLQTYLVELLMKQDQMSMAASIESRVPYLDHAFVEHGAGISSRLKLRGFRTKVVLREAVRDLVPPEILTRSKMGFPTPVGPWLRGRFWPLVEELVLGPRALRRGWFSPETLRRIAGEHRSGHWNHGDRLWLLLNLEIWQRIFIDGEDIESLMPGEGKRGARAETSRLAYAARG